MTTKPLALPAPTPRPSNVCPKCYTDQCVFRVVGPDGSVVERRCCFVCGYGVPPSMWAEHQIERYFLGSELSGWMITAQPLGLN